MRHTITVTTNQGQEHQVVWDDISGEVFGDLAEQLREVMARSTATGYVSGYGFPAICKDPYHDPDDFVAVLDLFGTVTLPYELRGAKGNYLVEEIDPNAVY